MTAGISGPPFGSNFAPVSGADCCRSAVAVDRQVAAVIAVIVIGTVLVTAVFEWLSASQPSLLQIPSSTATK